MQWRRSPSQNTLVLNAGFVESNLIYVNIALPARLQADVVEWTDLNLDYRVHLDCSVELLDQEEFEQNVQRMGYPPNLIEQVGAACREVEAGLAKRMFSFDHERQVELYRRIKTEHLPA